MTQAKVIDGKAVATGLRNRIAAEAARLRNETDLTAGLATVLVGSDPSSQVYVRGKVRACSTVGIASFELRLPGEISEAALLGKIEKLNADDRVDGILVQLPLPHHIDPQRIISAIDPAKDVDGLHPFNVGRLWSGRPGLVPCTPQGCLILLRTIHADLAGAAAVVRLIHWNSDLSCGCPPTNQSALKILCLQCSLFACANIISSTSVGSRPSSA